MAGTILSVRRYYSRRVSAKPRLSEPPCGGDLVQRRRVKRFLVLILFPIPRMKGEAEGSARPEPPKLILVLVIDQFRYDYLVRFRPEFVAGGFKLLLCGANFVDCRYDYAATATCPAHATLLTGAYPNVHGIIGNDWYDKRRHRKVYCVEDPDANLVGGSVGPGSRHAS